MNKMNKSTYKSGKPVLVLWFSQGQKNEAMEDNKALVFGKLKEDESIVEYTEARRVEDDVPDRKDAVSLGIGDFHHREKR